MTEIRRWIMLCEDVRSGQALILVSPDGKAETFHMAFTDFLKQRNLPHVGSLVDAGSVWCNISWINGSPQSIAYWKAANRKQISALRSELAKLDITDGDKITVQIAGHKVNTTVGQMYTVKPPKPPRTRKPSKQLSAAEDMGVSVIDDDVFGSSISRVIWEKTNVIEAHDPVIVSLADNRNEYPGIYALHVGDADFWFHKLIDDYDNEPIAWEIEITGAKGDVLVDDVQYTMKFDSNGYEEAGDSAILLTTRRFLREGKDFRYVRQLKDER